MTRPALARAFGVSAVVIGAAIAAVVIASGRASSSAGVNRLDELPASPASALRVPEPVPLRAWIPVFYRASIRSDAAARAAPDADAPVIARLGTTTPEDTTNIVLVLGRAKDRAGGLWVHVRLPVLPNNLTGWVPRRALGVYGVVHTRLVVDLRGLTATLFRDGRAIFRAPVGIGLPQSPTPRGNFYIRSLSTMYSSPFYGPLAFGTSARSTVLTDWPGGGFVGIHGTDQPALIPGRVSHGCIRLRNRDIITLGRLMEIGTPVKIR
jgi:hypothetical protein